MTTTHGFELIQEQNIQELNTRARLFRHVKTGAELLSLENEDENKVFGITFRTPPSDSTGLPHIMEHSVLCGSRKYPVKEPFVELMKGSLNTFLNAMTYPDKTCYPVASQNLQDFYNLVDVYLDSVFYPLISPYTLQQEGWHYELENGDETLSFKGVVYNEMKGIYSSPDAVLYEQSQQSLFPDNVYGFDSGGDPAEIPNLTYEQFKSFHETNYHPSNAYLFFYGDDDPEERLRILNAYLDDFEPLVADSEVPLQPRFAEPRKFVFPYDAGDSTDEKKSLLTVNWLLSEVGDPETTLGLGILGSILIETPASPLRKALIDSGLGEDLTGRGLEQGSRQMFFSTGMKGVARGDADKVEELIFITLETLSQEGIDPDTVAAAVNTVEFRLRENNTGALPRGLLLMMRSLTTWLYGYDPLAPLAFEAPLEEIKTRLSAGEPYFENLIKNQFLANPHRTMIILKPDTEAGKQREAAEMERLAQARAAMSATELQVIVDNTAELKRRQETPDPPEALTTIPRLELSDLEKEIKRIPLEILEQGETSILYHNLFTNGILYLDVGFNLHALKQEWLPYVPLFAQALLEMGTESEDYVRLSQRIGRSTGGIRPNWFTSVARDSGREVAWLFLRGKATVPQAEELLAILRDVLLTIKLDDQGRFRQMVLEAKASQETQLIPMGHRMVNRRLRSRFNPADWASEQMEGVSALFFLRQLVELVDRDWPAVLQTLEDIRRALVNRQNMLLNVTLDQENWTKIYPGLGNFLNDLPATPAILTQWLPADQPHFEGLTIPTQVNYVGKGVNLYRLGYEQHGSVLVVTSLLRNTWLWDKVRVQGGAYGAFCPFDRLSGVLTFISYRDPNVQGTLEVYDQSGEFLRQLDIDQAELTKSIIGVIGEMDAYQLPDAQGYTSMTRYLTGVTDDDRQRIRTEVLATTQQDFRAFGDMLDRVKDKGQVVVLGSVEAIENLNKDGKWMETLKVL